MRRLIYILFLFTTLNASAQDYFVDTVDGRCVMQGSVNFNGLSDEVIFSNLLLWIYNNEAGSVKDKDFGHSLILMQKITDGQDPNNYFSTKMSFTLEHGNLKFIATDIVKNGKSGFTYSAKPFEKLKPQNKPKDKQIIMQFEDFEKQVLKSLFDFIRTNKLPRMSYSQLANIKQGKVIEGMNETEVTLAVGKPQNILNTGDEIQWMISSSCYVFFKNGKVSAVVK